MKSVILIAFFLKLAISTFAQSDSLTNDMFSTHVFRKGIFISYEDFLNNRPSGVEEFTIQEELVSGFPVYKIRNEKGKQIKNVYGFSDGTSVFINSALYQNHSTYYLKALLTGKVFYFRDPIATAVSTSIYLGYGGFVLGLAAASVTGKNFIGIILYSADNGVVFKLNKKSLQSILMESDPELLNQYLSEKDLGDPFVLEEYILRYNTKNH